MLISIPEPKLERFLALTGSDLEPEMGLGFSNGTTEDADGSKLEPRFVFLDGRQARQSFVCGDYPF